MTPYDTRIHSPELAVHMAYAEKPFMDVAVGALALGEIGRQAYDLLVQQATLAGIAEAKRYISELQENLLYYETTPSREVLARVARSELFEFAEQRHHRISNASRLWNVCVSEAWGQSQLPEYKQDITFDTDAEELSFYVTPHSFVENLRSIGTTSLNLLDEFLASRADQSDTN